MVKKGVVPGGSASITAAHAPPTATLDCFVHPASGHARPPLQMFPRHVLEFMVGGSGAFQRQQPHALRGEAQASLASCHQVGEKPCCDGRCVPAPADLQSSKLLPPPFYYPSPNLV